ncbi:uncharacterized protein LOC122013618 [Zingiber officinale]|uniref:uncharacterized protein LOC122013618 n=1 Tax=Zingiber officinale TaxID=94328 RepID=UPI001C4CA5D0|nr:uncharacterized protein LOC122013618 [Zingiber officinale]
MPISNACLMLIIVVTFLHLKNPLSFFTFQPNHSKLVVSSMEMIMVAIVIEESGDISSELISCLLDSVRDDDKGILPVVRKVGEKVIRNCAAKLKPHFLKLSQSVASFSNNSSKVVDSICQESYGRITQNNTNSGEIMMTRVNFETLPKVGRICFKETATLADLGPLLALFCKSCSASKPGRPLAWSLCSTCHYARPVCFAQSESAKVEEMRLEEGTAPEKILNSVKSNAAPADKDVSGKVGPKDVKLEAVSVLESHKTNADTANDTNSFSDKMKIPIATRQKRGRFSSKLSAAKQSVSPLQEKVSKVVDKSCSPKDIELKEPDSEDSANVKQTTVSKGLVEKSQRRRGLKGSRSNTNDEHTLQKLQRSTIKQHDTLKSQDDTSREPVVKIYGTRMCKKEVGKNLVGSKISVWWPMDKNEGHELGDLAKVNLHYYVSLSSIEFKFASIVPLYPSMFYNGVVDSYDNISRKHKITYIDGEVERLLLSKECWKLIKDGSKQDTKQREDSNNQ